jgi:hypothetical protein
MHKNPNGPATARMRELLDELNRLSRGAKRNPGVALVLDRTKRTIRREVTTLSSCRHTNSGAAQRSLSRVANAMMDALQEILNKTQIWLLHLQSRCYRYVSGTQH